MIKLMGLYQPEGNCHPSHFFYYNFVELFVCRRGPGGTLWLPPSPASPLYSKYFPAASPWSQLGCTDAVLNTILEAPDVLSLAQLLGCGEIQRGSHGSSWDKRDSHCRRVTALCQVQDTAGVFWKTSQLHSRLSLTL